ncbi:LDL receptor repeat-containing protein egg-1-like isoform X1 [Strongylocentrotus purpuratus]|uniref:Uncharacterized protein n=1 Tax=Strongylocentrotus purpuratus TaxID=7668 RepID=A0A7M7PN87_STRPU|nr:LDL receptor repeat-containing protein egg-1-like isoform X1 [Strongylocentrotus purpuratus]
MKMASKTMIALYSLIALAVAASALVKEDLIQIPDALNVEENQSESPDVCGEDQDKCALVETCYDASDKCDGIYDCPVGIDEFNCEGCFACSDSSDCLNDVRVCDFYKECPGGEDESESLCKHSEFIKNVQVPTGDWVTIDQRSGGDENRNTPASYFKKFTHYVFQGEPGTTLFMELLDVTWSDGPLVSLFEISAGAGDDPTNAADITYYLAHGGNEASISNSRNNSLKSNTGFAMINFPKGIHASVQLRVTAIACESPESLCFGSPHCMDRAKDMCNGKYDCVYSQEDELKCDGGKADDNDVMAIMIVMMMM